MASARRKSAGGGSAKKSKPVAKAKGPAKKPAAKAKPAMKAKPAPKPAAKPVKAAKPALKPAPKLAPKPAAKPAPVVAKKVIGKPAVPGKKVIGKPAVPGKKVVGIPAVPAKPVRVGPPRLVPATAEARLKAIKPPTGKKAVNRAPAEVRPLGVLPPESQAKPRFAPPRLPALPSRSASNRPAPPKPVIARKPDEGLGPDDMKHFETRLLAERVRIMREMGHIESTILKVNPRDSAGDLSGYSFHMADAGTDSMEREKAFDIASKEGRLLMEIDDALRRLYGGTYGICEVSGKPISRARLEALPWARLSLEEQEKLEREQRAGRLAPSAE